MLIPITGITEESLTNMSTEAKAGGLRPFPCDGFGWTRHTGCVLKAEIKHFDNSGDSIAITVVNAQYGAEILVNLDPSQVPPGTKDQEKVRQDNLETLTKLIKVLGAHTKGQLDTTKLEKAKNVCVEFIAKHKGFTEGRNGGTFHKITYIFKGGADDITDVTGPQLPPLPGAAASSGPIDPLDIPF